MRSGVIVIASIGSQDSAQMRLAQDDEMIHTLAPDRSDQPFGEAILPRRGWCSSLSRMPMAAQWARDHGAVPFVPRPRQAACGGAHRKRACQPLSRLTDGPQSTIGLCRLRKDRNFRTDIAVRGFCERLSRKIGIDQNARFGVCSRDMRYPLQFETITGNSAAIAMRTVWVRSS
jgi:hypothetical protein